MVRDFHKKFKQTISDKPELPNDTGVAMMRIGLLEEEFNEYLDAEDKNDLVEIADALGDMIYIIAGTALVYGIPLDRVFREIHESNMTKDPTTPPNEKLRKGPDFKPVDLHWLQEGAGE